MHKGSVPNHGIECIFNLKSGIKFTEEKEAGEEVGAESQSTSEQ